MLEEIIDREILFLFVVSKFENSKLKIIHLAIIVHEFVTVWRHLKVARSCYSRYKQQTKVTISSVIRAE